MSLTLQNFSEGGTYTLRASGVAPNEQVRFIASRTVGDGPCAGTTCADLVSPQTLGTANASLMGIAELQRPTPSSFATGEYLLFQAVVVDPVAGYVSPVVLGMVEDPTCLTVSPTDGYYDRFEGTAGDNTCVVDRDCVVGGCSAEICAATLMPSTCELLPYLPSGDCGCVQGVCVWNDGTCP
jgi:eight-cysteine-cluster-containing protein